ncbi:MAG TPA: 2,3-bisphosphoglycerate-independent phosphoglycerate mutase, partial [Patescibacteria group bacterium]
MDSAPKFYKQVLLVIFDGWGIRKEKLHNAIEEANKPFFDSLWEKYPHTQLSASGRSVGLPDGEMGNSEVGHLTIGAGTPVDTDVVRIFDAIEKHQLLQNQALAT